MTLQTQPLFMMLAIALLVACGDDANRVEADNTAQRVNAPEPVVPPESKNPPDQLRIKQGVWGFVTAGLELAWFRSNPTGQDAVQPTMAVTLGADGFYQFPFEPGESGWFCMIDGPHDSATLMSDCVEWTAEPGLKRCDLNDDGWDC